MPEFDPDQEMQRVRELVEQGELDAAEKLLWPRGANQDWFENMAPMVEFMGGGYEQTDKARAIWCYTQAKALYEATISGTSGGEMEAEAQMMQGRTSHLDKKIWLLKS